MANDATLRTTIKAQAGKLIEVTNNQNQPENLELVIKNNRGRITDTLIISFAEFLKGQKSIESFYAIFANKDE